nr:MAG TPA_asm: hypothetical protein [Caudoviricetes sp.]DAR21183.1 MAG TPA: hypothetical protein [Caudoviricetes sp.]
MASSVSFLYLLNCFHLLVLTWFNLTTTQFNCQACF